MDNFAQELELNTLMDSFYAKKDRLDYYKKETDSENKRIKELMTELNLTEFVNDNGLQAKITVQKRENFMEDKLINYLNENNFLEAIELVPTINYDKLEDMIYNGRINASELAEYKTIKEVPTLKISKKKEK